MKTTKLNSQSSSAFGSYGRIGNLKTMMTLGVSTRGNSLCIIIPKDLVDVEQIISGDKVRVWFLDHYRKRKEEE
jgi:hypothetical protein